MIGSHRSLTTLAITATLCASTIGHAEEADDALEGITDIEQVDLTELLGSVTAVSRREESVFTAPAAVTVLDQADIHYSGATHIADLLRRAPGVQVLETSPGNYLVSLRGTGGVVGNNIVVLLDGVPLNSTVDAAVDWGIIPIDPHQIERVEIVRGPVSTVYGANAYTGVINIVSLAPSARGARATAHIESGIDSRARVFGSTSVGVGATSGRWRWRLTLDSTYDDLYSDSAHGRQPALRKGSATAFVEVRLRPNMTLGLRLAGGIAEHSSVDHLVLESLPLTRALGLGELRFTWQRPAPLLDSVAAWARARYEQVDTRGDEFEAYTPDGMHSVDWDLGVDLHFKLPKGFSADVGASGGGSVVTAPYLHPLVSGAALGRVGYYATVGVDVMKRVMLSIGTRGDASAFFDGVVQSYRSSLIYRRRLWSIRLSGGSAFRTPSYIEAAARFIDPATHIIAFEGSPALHPPENDSGELGVIAFLADRLTIRPTLYFQRLSNLVIEDFRSLTLKTFRNDPTPRLVLGAELEAELKISGQLSLEASFAGLYFLPVGSEAEPPTIGVATQNSAITAYLGFRGRFLEERLGVSLGLLYTSSRSYDLRTGVPPAALLLDTPNLVRLDASAYGRVSRRIPLSVYLKLRSHLPHAIRESPMPGAATLGTSVVLGVEYRGD